MAAQPDRSPVNMSSDFDAPAVTPTLVLPAPMTPVLTTGLDFKTLYDNCDPFHRRPQPDIPFFTEPDAEGRDGPLPTYSSHRLTASERKWPITELEGLAVLHFVRYILVVFSQTS